METIYWILGIVLTIGVLFSTLLGVILRRICKQRDNKIREIKADWRLHHK